MAYQEVHTLWNGHGYTQQKQTREKRMTNKKEVSAELKRMVPLSPQDDKGQFVMGEEMQGYAADFVEQIITGATPTINHVPQELDARVAAATLLALKDIQVRDYAMGLLRPGNEIIASRLQWLTDVAPKDYIAAPTTLLALTHYEKHEDGKANEALVPALAQGYSLATLLNRVFQTNWPVDAFQSVRMELHPKVTANIFGESHDRSK
jgi:hypothetical protein